ncbi:MAG: ABC transporter transmembrane domain-containing protein, partial [Bacteroidota bacterium]
MGRPFREMASERKRLPLRAFSFSFFLSRKFARYGVPALLAVLLAQSSGISLTYILKELVDAITIKDESMWNWAFVYVGLFAVSATLWRTSGFLGMYWITHTRSETNRRLYRWLSQHSSRYFANQFAGSLAGKVSNAANGLNHMLSKVLWDFLPTFLRLFLSMVLAYIANPVMALIMAIWAGLFLVINGWLVKKKAVLSRSTAESYTRLKGQMV